MTIKRIKKLVYMSSKFGSFSTFIFLIIFIYYFYILYFYDKNDIKNIRSIIFFIYIGTFRIWWIRLSFVICHFPHQDWINFLLSRIYNKVIYRISLLTSGGVIADKFITSGNVRNGRKRDFIIHFVLLPTFRLRYVEKADKRYCLSLPSICRL